jgi:hypothetical protein
MFNIPIGWFGIPGGFEWIIYTGYSSVNLWQKASGYNEIHWEGFVEFKKGLKGVKDEVDEVEGDIKILMIKM